MHEIIKKFLAISRPERVEVDDWSKYSLNQEPLVAVYLPEYGNSFGSRIVPRYLSEMEMRRCIDANSIERVAQVLFDRESEHLGKKRSLQTTDTERLDWLEKNGQEIECVPGENPSWTLDGFEFFPTARQAIDAAMEAAK